MTLQRRPPAKAGSRIAAPRLELLLTEIRSRDEVVRRQARATLTTIGVRAVPQLLPLLQDPEPVVRAEIATILVAVADPRSAMDLVTALEDDSEDVRGLARAALIAIGREALVSVLEGLMKRHESSILRRGCRDVLHAVAHGGLEPMLRPIITALDGDDPETDLREPSWRALQKLKG